MTTRSVATHSIHLDRAARSAGEAFAVDEPDSAPVAARSLWSNALWLGIAVVALGGLYFIV